MIRTVRGFKDILPPQVRLWQHVEWTTRRLFDLYGYEEIRTPVLEHTELFLRTIGETTDIVEKEMYTFSDRDGSSLTLRPEGTAGVVRAYIEHSMYKRSPVSKLYYIGTMFRHERPQRGRYRAFNQVGAEHLGSAHPYADSETISMLWRMLDALGLTASLSLELSSLGDAEAREAFKARLVDYLVRFCSDLCPACMRRLRLNPLRILDCKVEGCRAVTEDAPSILDHLNPESRDHFEQVREALEAADIPYVLNPRIVRGLDYYSRTVFEVTTEELGAQNSVAAGGRYDGLVELLGGPPTPAVGFALGVERVVMLLESGGSAPERPGPFVYVAHMGDEALDAAWRVAERLRGRGVRTEVHYDKRSLKSQMKRADKLGATHCVIIGEDEVKAGEVTLRYMAESREERVAMEELEARLAEGMER